MLRHKETLIGAAALIVLVFLLGVSAANRRIASDNGSDQYVLTAVFNRTDGLRAGAPVRLAGVEVGRVLGQELDKHFRARVTFGIAPGVAVPADSAAIIETDGILGEKYVEIQPGGLDEMLKPGDRIEYTQDSVVIEDLLAKIVARAKSQREEAAAEPPPLAKGTAAEGAPAEGAAGASPFPPLFGAPEDQKRPDQPKIDRVPGKLPEGKLPEGNLPEGQQETFSPSGADRATRG